MSEKTDAVVDATDRELNLGDKPYIYAPYPDYIMQVHDGDTRGAREVIEIINEHWPANIEELEAITEEMYDGYSGSFIRNILRNNYAPQDILDVQNTSNSPTEIGVESTATEIESGSVTGSVSEQPPENEVWHKTFRLGIRVAFEGEIEEEEAFEAFGSGFVEGLKLKEEME